MFGLYCYSCFETVVTLKKMYDTLHFSVKPSEPYNDWVSYEEVDHDVNHVVDFNGLRKVRSLPSHLYHRVFEEHYLGGRLVLDLLNEQADSRTIAFVISRVVGFFFYMMVMPSESFGWASSAMRIVVLVAGVHYCSDKLQQLIEAKALSDNCRLVIQRHKKEEIEEFVKYYHPNGGKYPRNWKVYHFNAMTKLRATLIAHNEKV